MFKRAGDDIGLHATEPSTYSPVMLKPAAAGPEDTRMEALKQPGIPCAKQRERPRRMAGVLSLSYGDSGLIASTRAMSVEEQLSIAIRTRGG